MRCVLCHSGRCSPNQHSESSDDGSQVRTDHSSRTLKKSVRPETSLIPIMGLSDKSRPLNGRGRNPTVEKHSLLSSISSLYEFELCSNCSEEVEFDDWIVRSDPASSTASSSAKSAAALVLKSSRMSCRNLALKATTVVIRRRSALTLARIAARRYNQRCVVKCCAAHFARSWACE